MLRRLAVSRPAVASLASFGPVLGVLSRPAFRSSHTPRNALRLCDFTEVDAEIANIDTEGYLGTFPIPQHYG
jgi:hypothetical protein